MATDLPTGFRVLTTGLGGLATILLSKLTERGCSHYSVFFHFIGLSLLQRLRLFQESTPALASAPIPALFPHPTYGDRDGWWMAQLEENR